MAGRSVRLLDLVLLTTNIAKFALGQTYDNVATLKTQLLTGYDATIRPVIMQSNVLNVNISLNLYNIQEVDTVKGSMTLTALVLCSWLDEKITWTPSSYNGITSVMFKQSQVWIPTIALASPVEFTVMGETWMHVTYQFNGLAIWQPGDVIESSCTYNLKHWPFDKQICDILFIPFDHFDTAVMLKAVSIIEDSMNPNGEWMLEETVVETRSRGTIQNKFSVAKFRLKIARYPAFYVITVVIPLIAIGSLNAFVFLLPCEAGERVSYSITMLLSITVFLTVIADTLPKVSEPLPIITLLITLGLVLSFLTMLLVILNIGIYHRDEAVKMAAVYKAFGRYGLCRCRNEVSVECTSGNVGLADSHGGHQRPRGSRISESNSVAYNRDKENNSFNSDKGGNSIITLRDKEEPITWRDVSNGIDRILFIGFTTVHMIPCVCIVLYMWAGSQYFEPPSSLL